MLPLTIALVLAVLCLAGMVKAAPGSGESLVAMPLLALVVGVVIS